MWVSCVCVPCGYVIERERDRRMLPTLDPILTGRASTGPAGGAQHLEYLEIK